MNIKIQTETIPNDNGFNKINSTTTLITEDKVKNKEEIIDNERLPDNISGISIFIPIDETITYPPEFEENSILFKLDKQPVWDFEHKEYKIFKNIKLQKEDSFKVHNKTITIKDFIDIPDELGKNITYIIFLNNNKMSILPDIIFYTIFHNVIIENFIKEPYIKFPQNRIEISFEEDRIYPLEFESDGVLVNITAANTSGHYTQDLNNPNKVVLTPQDSIEFYVKDKKLFFKPLRPELNVVTFKVVDSTYSKSKLETIVIKVNQQTTL